MAGSKGMLAVKYVVVVAAVVSGTLALGSVLWQLGGSGAHAGHGVPGVSTLGVTVDALGVVTMALLGLQLMSGYHLIRLHGRRFRGVHIALGLTLTGLAVLHGGGAVVHTLEAPEALLVALDVMGAVLLAVVGVQIASGYRQTSARRVRYVHVAVAVVVGATLAAHGLLGVLHTVTG